ncbi:MFS general substrate transporter [Coniophora puteana RWD-64-598 SS2]|uniref:MFS general substrate transporter n=1 Tax=Coniophora puteana (strain RWD-64-598) TaxID=741705 RepID=A0A5M3MSL4_CONPW|nr:MFS general substrate transporter [Coniophora puteana RWD-64-598 SS2]EIW81521.1 MFS general substrate transporter [Coniophora puteana RWD-64-598 SS2]
MATTSPTGTLVEGSETSTAAPVSPVSETSVMTLPGPKTDMWIVPIPKRLQYDPEKPFYFGLFLNVFFGVASTLVVANLYYCQPLLIEISHSFHVTYDEVSRIPTLVQAGYGIGLLLISPLGDMVRRRQLILGLIVLSAVLSIPLAVTSSLRVFEVISFLMGMATVSPQIMIPLAADLAPPSRRASAISIVISGFLLGILTARVLAGIVGNYTSWRIVYWMSAGVQGFVVLAMYCVLPDYPVKNKGLSYFGMYRSMAKFVVTEPVVPQIMLINFAASACYTNFWVTLTFLLGGAPYFYSTIIIGLFGLLGALGVVVVPFMGRLIDRIVPWYATLISTIFLLVFQAVQTGAGGISIAAVIIACFGLDVFRQTQQISLATRMFSVNENARARLNALLILSVFLGQIMGTAAGTEVFVGYGWRADSLLSMGWYVWQFLILVMRGPHTPSCRWFGYEGGFRFRRDPMLDSSRRLEEAEGELSGTSTHAEEKAEEKVEEKGTSAEGRGSEETAKAKVEEEKVEKEGLDAVEEPKALPKETQA